VRFYLFDHKIAGKGFRMDGKAATGCCAVCHSPHVDLPGLLYMNQRLLSCCTGVTTIYIETHKVMDNNTLHTLVQSLERIWDSHDLLL
jgi:hypothetical protein